MKSAISITFAALFLTLLVFTPSLHPAWAQDWRKDYPKIVMGIITSENESDRLTRWKPVRTYLSKTLGVEVDERLATDYAGVIEGVKAKKVDLAYFGPASFSRAWLVTNHQVQPLVAKLNGDGSFGYHSIIVVKKDSPYQKIEDLKGKKFAFADPNSTSGHQAPRFFLHEQGIDVDTFFGKTEFSGSHENSIIALLNGTFDAAATWWNSPTDNNPTRMEQKGMIKPGQWRIIWKSPTLPNDPWSMPTWLPEQMREAVRQAILQFPEKDPAAFEKWVGKESQGFKSTTVEDYQPIIRMIQANMKQRKS
jgi:phosphonate transport system substrate-binding protein